MKNATMKLLIFRSLGYPIASDVTPDPDAEPFPMFSFSPIPAEEPRMLIGSGPYPWQTIDVPDGSRVAYDALFLPGNTEGLHPEEVVALFLDHPTRSGVRQSI